jgi:hypothetical protein
MMAVLNQELAMVELRHADLLRYFT